MAPEKFVLDETAVTLREWIDHRIELARQERAVQIGELHSTIRSNRENHDREHALHKESWIKFEESIAEKFKLYNAFRDQINAERADFVRRDVLDERLAALQTYLESQIISNSKRIETNQEVLLREVDTMSDSMEKRLRPLENSRIQLLTVIAVGFALITLIEFGFGLIQR